MKNFGVAGLLAAILIVVAVVGRFHQQPTISLLGHSFQAQSLLLLANTVLVAGIYSHLRCGKKDG